MNYVYIKPSTLNIDSSVSELEICQGCFRIWITELVKPGKPDDDCTYVFESLLSLLDNGWACQFREGQECNDANLETINQILLILFPKK